MVSIYNNQGGNNMTMKKGNIEDLDGSILTLDTEKIYIFILKEEKFKKNGTALKEVLDLVGMKFVNQKVDQKAKGD